MDLSARQVGRHSLHQPADRNTPPTSQTTEALQHNPLHWPIFDLITPGHACCDRLPGAATGFKVEHIPTGLEDELNAMLEPTDLHPTHQHFQTLAAGLSKGFNAVSNGDESGKTPMERFQAEGYCQGGGIIVDKTTRAPGFHLSAEVKDESAISRTLK